MVDASYTSEAFARALVLAPSIFLIGAVIFRLCYPEHSGSWLSFWSTCVAVELIVVVLFRALMHSYAAFGNDAFSWESIHLIVVESRWGTRWKWQFLSAIGIFVSLVISTPRNKAGWLLAGFFVSCLCISLPLTGHAMALGFPILIVQAGHILGAGIWVGTLAVLTLHRYVVRKDSQLTFKRFKPLALTGASLLIASGVFSAWQAIPSVTSVWQSGYGRILLLKIGLVLLVMVFGYLNSRKFQKPSSSGKDWIWEELFLATAVIVVTGWLGETGTP